MCMRTSSIIGTSSWNWAGDEVVFDRIVPSNRMIPNTNVGYTVDIRTFLTHTKNDVIRNAIDEALAPLSHNEQALFFRREKGAFDHRVLVLAEYLCRNVSYKSKRSRRPDAWQFPEETLALGEGDCEDHAFLLASLLLASGISGYMIRVALGQIVERKHDGSRGTVRDHAWVVYLDEQGHWLVLDPLLYFRDSAETEPSNAVRSKIEMGYEYIPHFVFNDEHLWAIRRNSIDSTLPDYLSKREFFDDFDPKFGVSVHNYIFDTALTGMSWFKRQYVKAVSLAMDVNILTYDPRDHFDNGYIDEGFALVEQRLAGRSLGDFAQAAHAIGDFYAHSTYELFGKTDNGTLLHYDPMTPQFDAMPDYGPGGVCPLADPRFTVNDATYTGDRQSAADRWKGRIISGRYAQNGDPHQGIFERVTYIPRALRQQPDYPERAMLPHHNEIAVDSPTSDTKHCVYPDPSALAAAFTRRQNAAVEHVRAAYQRWKK